MEKHYRTVVQGEASESDSEEEILNERPKSIVVEGEASESDEEELDSSGRPIGPRELPPLKLNEHSTSFESIDDISSIPTLSYKQAGKPRHDTVLNRKLWESNLSLCNNLSGMVSQAYLSAAKEINNCGQQLSRSHASIQDVSHNMRLLTNDLFNLDDHIDIIATCKLLPNIKLPEKTSTSPGQAAAPTPTIPESSVYLLGSTF